MKAKREQINKDCKAIFESEAKSIFDKYPKLERFSWTQYTPHFNDGDACEFGVRNHDIPITYDGKDFDDVSKYTFDTSESYCDDNAISLYGFKDAFVEIDALLKNFEEDDYKFMFGDHVEITVSRDGVNVEEYEHD